MLEVGLSVRLQPHSFRKLDSDGHRPEANRDDDLPTEQPDAVVKHAPSIGDESPAEMLGFLLFPNSRTLIVKF